MVFTPHAAHSPGTDPVPPDGRTELQWHLSCCFLLTMKRSLRILSVVALLAAIAAMSYLRTASRTAGEFNGAKLLEATRAYAQELRARGTPVPATVSLQELLQRGLLQETDVSLLQGMDVRINLAADASRPADVLVRVQMPDGREIVALTDGSVQQRHR